jgi:hypothetical protein
MTVRELIILLDTRASPEQEALFSVERPLPGADTAGLWLRVGDDQAILYREIPIEDD